MSDNVEMRQRVPEPLWPMLEIKREGWKTVLGTSNGIVWAILLRYKDLNECALSVGYSVYGDKPFMVGHHGMDYGYYDTLEEALEVIEQLFPKVEREFHWNNIANFCPPGRWKAFIQLRGIGPKTVTRLVKAFATLERLRGSTADDIENVTGIGKRTAQLIADYFRPDPTQLDPIGVEIEK